MATKSRAYYVSVSVELAPGEERREGEYGYSEGFRIEVSDWGTPGAEYAAIRAAKAVRTGIGRAEDDQRAYVKSQSWWRRLFNRGN